VGDKDYRAYLEYLAREYIEPRLARVRDEWCHHFRFEKWTHHEHRLRRATKLLRFAYRDCETEDEIYRTLKGERIREAADAIRDGARFGKWLADEVGVLDCLDSHFDRILARLRVKHLPKEDLRVLAELGSTAPREDLEGIIYVLRTSRLRTIQHWSEKPLVRSEFERAQERLDSEVESLSTESKNSGDEPPKKKRRWFKGLGQVGQGAALTIANVGLAVGAFSFPVSPETQTWGALTSATTGLGMVLTGVGELRGE